MSRFYPTLAICAFLAFILPGCEEEKIAEQVTLKLNWRHGSNFAGFYVAQKKGYYAGYGLDVAIEPLVDPSETRAVFDRVASGEYDFSLGGFALVQAQAEGQPLVAIANIVKYSPATLFARKSSGIVTPADLAGKKIAIKADAWRDLIAQLLEKFDLTLGDVVQVRTGFDMAPFYESKIDVWAGFINDEAVRARLNGLDIVTLPLHEYGIRTTARTIFASRTLLEEKPRMAERFVAATVRGWRWAIENPESAIDLMLELYPDMAGDRDFHVASLRASIPLWVPPGANFGEIDCTGWRAHDAFASLDGAEALCTETVYDDAIDRIGRQTQ